MDEIWKDILGYEGLYKISNFGRVFGKKRNMILGLRKNDKGYIQYFLSKDGKQINYLLHRLVAQAFIPNPDNKPQVNHINGIKSDNCIENLEWCTEKENMKHSYSIGLQKPKKGTNHYAYGKYGKYNHSSKKINQYTNEGKLIKNWDSIADIGREMGLPTGQISLVCNGKAKTCGGFKWAFDTSIL